MSTRPSDTRARHRGAIRGLLALGLSTVMATAAAEIAGPDDEPAIHAPLVRRSLFLDGDAIGDHLVIVGERGHILVSRDGGRTWTQAQVPTRTTLTGVSLADAARGWAVGHDAVILRTGDGGGTWEIVYAAPEQERPLLDVWFENAKHGFAVGAYGLFLETRDGGDTWEPRRIAEDDNHLNNIAAASAKQIYVAAERGAIYRSDDGGRTWRSLPSPYAGSFFGTLPLDQRRVYLYGLRGNLFYSANAGTIWQRIDTRERSLLTGGIHIGPDDILFSGAGGTLLSGRVAANTIGAYRRADRAGIAGILDAGDGALVVFGEFGVERIPAESIQPVR